MGKGKALPHALRGDQPFSTVQIPPGGSPIPCEAASLKSLDPKPFARSEPSCAQANGTGLDLPNAKKCDCIMALNVCHAFLGIMQSHFLE